MKWYVFQKKVQQNLKDRSMLQYIAPLHTYDAQKDEMWNPFILNKSK